MPRGRSRATPIIFNGDASASRATSTNNVVAFNGDVIVTGHVGENVIASNGTVTLAERRAGRRRRRLVGHAGRSRHRRRRRPRRRGSVLRCQPRTVHGRRPDPAVARHDRSRRSSWGWCSCCSFRERRTRRLRHRLGARRVDRVRVPDVHRRADRRRLVAITVLGRDPARARRPAGARCCSTGSATRWAPTLLGRRAAGRPPACLAFLAGWAILRMLALIPVVGGLVWLAATVWGLGALVLAAARGRPPTPDAGAERSVTAVGSSPPVPPPPPILPG